MAHLETFSTLGLDPRRKIEYWNDCVCASFTPNTSEPVDLRAFNGHITRTDVGDLSAAEVYSDPSWRDVQITRNSWSPQSLPPRGRSDWSVRPSWPRDST